MKDLWYDRFVQLIQADSRGMKAISLAARCGENYVQQMIRDGKRPTVDKFMAILEVLGDASALYVLTGLDISAEDVRLFEYLVTADEKKRSALATLLSEDNEAYSEQSIFAS